MEYRDLLPIAIHLAVEAHGATIGKDGTPYILHPLRLMTRANGYAEQIVAVLHDTVEDTYLNLDILREEGFPKEIRNAVGALTRKDGETYEEFIERIAENPLATAVKLLDLYDNIDATRLPELGDKELQRIAKYHRAIVRLKAITTATP
ncbi:MAG: GTP pyrophosphokinase [Akkermansiaceae bacterium]|nr:GTP pyrophosphokinase [Armatimonadota bacterium]